MLYFLRMHTWLVIGGEFLSKPVKADAELALSVFATMRSDEDFKRAEWWFFQEFDAKSHRAFKKKFPVGSKGLRNFVVFANYWEVLGTLVNDGLLNEDLAFDMFGCPWKKAEPVVHGIRKDMKIPRLYENFEVLGKRFSDWEKKHPPKV